MLETTENHPEASLPPSAANVVVSSQSAEVTRVEATSSAVRPSAPASISSETFPAVPTDISASSDLAKRVFDIAGAIIIGLLALPVILLIAAMIRMSGPKVLFKQTRVGKDHRTFSCYKFRSMIPNAEEVLNDLIRSDPELMREWRENHKLVDDPRITRFGKFLRQTSLDELPQLWNVLRGDMSLVGPRPVVPDEMERYGNRVRYYCAVRPGMTGLWQISGRSHVTYSRRVSLDVLYVRQSSVTFDLWILWRTVFVVFQRVGAY